MQGEGPLVVLVHGFPESWYSWRHQLPALAAAGFKAVAVDMPGYGSSAKPEAINRYNQVALAADIAELATQLGADEFVVVGHDWGAPTAWHTALLYPDRVKAVVGLSVPYGGRPPLPPTQGMRRLFKDAFFYMLYFQEPGVAERELEADIPRFIRAFVYSCSGDNPRDYFRAEAFPADATLLQTVTDPGRPPAWMSAADLAFYVGEFERSGLRGPLNYYRNLDHTWRLTEHLQDRQILQPALFISGDRDPVPKLGREYQRMDHAVPGIEKIVIPKVGHWTQQEAPAAVNRALTAFLNHL
ncbi:alpha/beta hydrolase [Exilibacterium tricleocarpae]|uniref:Alpha/beta hydrolase n=2 Tax=Exilibacterium tricleocarpae TaxID=2591008 RepID=A0A545U493_9GAMM|nr:alpha/beta hydrolase [Exilibacterium tricleocarpae]